jgi:hypothetical protein
MYVDELVRRGFRGIMTIESYDRDGQSGAEESNRSVLLALNEQGEAFRFVGESCTTPYRSSTTVGEGVLIPRQDYDAFLVDHVVEDGPLFHAYQAKREADQAKAESTRLLVYPHCPHHNVRLVVRRNYATGKSFFGCPMFGKEHCRHTVEMADFVRFKLQSIGDVS